MKHSASLHSFLAWAAFGLMACSSAGDATDAPTTIDQRKPIGKADAPAGKCSDNGVSFCGGRSKDECYCDDACTGFGDCCADYATVCKASGPLLESIRLSFAKQFRTLKNDDVYLVYVSGRLNSSVSPIAELQLTGPDGDLILDKQDGFGNWTPSTGFPVADSRRFYLQTQENHPYPVGSYHLLLELENGAQFVQEVSVDRTDPQNRVKVSWPTSNEVTTDPRPMFRFDPYTSPLFSGVEKRSLSVLLETAAFRFLWEEHPTNPDLTEVAVGDPIARGVDQLTDKTEYVVTVCHLETRKSGFVDVALENRASVHFFFQ